MESNKKHKRQNKKKKDKLHPHFIKDIKDALKSGKPELVKKLKALATKEKGQEKRVTKKFINGLKRS